MQTVAGTRRTWSPATSELAWRRCAQRVAVGTAAAVLVACLVGGLAPVRHASAAVVPGAPFGQIAVVARGINAPRAITAGPDGNMWFTNRFAHAIGRVTPAGVVSIFADPAISFPEAITTGPDGNLWFTNADAVGRITPAGVVTSFGGDGISKPTAITLGPDGNIWWVGDQQVGRITPDGGIVTFTDDRIDTPRGLVAGPDGNLWFAIRGYAPGIGRITLGGQVTRFSIDNIGQPEQLAVGADGNLWFTNTSIDMIGRITPAGAITAFTGATVRRGSGITPGPDGSLWVAMPPGQIGQLTTAGDVTLHPAGGFPYGIATGADGNLWFTDTEGDSVGRMTPAGAVATYRGTGISGPHGITTGPDGNLWFTNKDNQSIGRINPSGAVANFSGAGIERPEGIASGPDGNLWFTNANPLDSSIGRITPGGDVTSYPLAPDALPTGITAGADGNLWFTNRNTHSIGRITPAGVVTTFGSPAEGVAAPASIVSGPDGNLWFTSYWYNVIGRITPTGVITTFTTPGLFGPHTITSGPDGNLWFTLPGEFSIGRITPAGTITLFGGSGIKGPTAIAPGPDGHLWFTNDTTRSVGRMSTSGLVVSTFPDTGRTSPFGMSFGPDGNLWLTDAETNVIRTVGTDRSGPDVPGAPTGVSATSEDRRSTVTWSAPLSDGGAPVTGYSVIAGNQGLGCTWGGGPLTCTVEGLPNGVSHPIYVVARNAVGFGPSPPAVAVVPGGVPSVPMSITATAGDTEVTITWAPPTPGGRAPVAGYTVTASPGGRTCTSLADPTWCTVRGLTNGTSYTFTVAATNANGTGPSSAASMAVTPTDAVAFHPLSPARILDSRPASPKVGPYATPWGPAQTREVAMTGVGGVPARARAVVANLTVTGTTAAGFLSIWPTGQLRPLASSVNWAPGQTVANAVTVMVGTGGVVSVFNDSGNADVIVDVVGYYDANPGDGLTPLTPARISDSRLAPGTPWGTGQARDVTVTGVGGVAAEADAVVVNITVTGTTTAGYLTIWPAGQPQPVASSLNWSAGQTVANAVTVKAGAGGKISILNVSGKAHVIVDIVGSFAPGTGHLFHPLAPTRIQDSRPPGIGPYATPWSASAVRDVQVGGAGGVPAGAAAALLNVTATATTAPSYLSVVPAGTSALASSLNWHPGQTVANAVTAKLGNGSRISIGNATGTIHVIADVAGWYG